MLHRSVHVQREAYENTGQERTLTPSTSEAGDRTVTLPAEIRDELSDHLDAYVAPNLSMCVHSTLGTAAAPFGPVRTPGLPLVPP